MVERQLKYKKGSRILKIAELTIVSIIIDLGKNHQWTFNEHFKRFMIFS